MLVGECPWISTRYSPKCLRSVISFLFVASEVVSLISCSLLTGSKVNVDLLFGGGGMTRVLNKELQNADSTNSSQYLLITKSFAVSRN